jgi:iron complex outermembrane receptor protein
MVEIDRPLLVMNATRKTLLAAMTAALWAPGIMPEPVRGAEVAEAPAVEEVTVTARRREESLENVPVAVVALDSAALAARNINSQEDLQHSIAGLVIRQSQNQNDLSYAMRGQTQDAFSGTLPGVLPYVNDVQLNTLSAGSIYDLASIQVLKGPQGTLFGRNVTGGAVLYTTARPTNKFGGYVTVGTGNYKAANAQGALNLPLVDNVVLLRIAGDYTFRDGYVRNLPDGNRLGVTNRKSSRVTLLVNPSDTVKSLTTVQYDWSGGNNVGQYAYSVYPLGATNNGFPLASSAAALFTPFLDNVTGPGSWANYLRLHPNAYPPGVVEFAKLEKTFPKYTVWDNEPSDHKAQSWLASNTTTYSPSETLQIKNILGASQAFTDDLTDLFGAPYAFEPQYSLLGTGYHYRTKQMSEEFQVLGKAFDRRLDYIMGLYVSYQKKHDTFNVTPFDVPGIGAHRIDNYAEYDTTYAVFAQGTYDTSSFTHLEGLSFTLGGRYTWAKHKQENLENDAYFGGPEERISFSKPSWQVGLEYQVTPNVLVYVEHRGSWRSGGFNGTAPPVPLPGTQGGNVFLPETVKDVELGTKFHGEFAGIPVRLNVAAYQSWVRQVQRVEYVNVPYQGSVVLAGLTANIPAGRVKGIEADADLRLTNWLRVGANAAFTDAKFTDNVSVIFTQTQVFGPYPDSPRFAGTVYGEVTVPTGAGPVSLRADVYHQTEQYFSSQNDGLVPGTKLDGYTLLGAHLDWHSVFGSGLTLSAYGKNLTNKFYFVGGLAQGGAFGINGAAMGVPRMYGVQASYEF